MELGGRLTLQAVRRRRHVLGPFLANSCLSTKRWLAGINQRGGTGRSVVAGHAWGQQQHPPVETTPLSATSPPTDASRLPRDENEAVEEPLECSLPRKMAVPRPEERQSQRQFTKEEILSFVEAFVPTVFTSVSQVARGVPDAVMEELVNVPEGSAGLAGYLTCHPRHFAVTRIGTVAVARRLRAQASLSATQVTDRLQRLEGTSHSARASTRNPTEEVARRMRLARAVKGQDSGVVPADVLEMIPPFLVPVQALLSLFPRPKVEALLRQQHRFLRYVNPFSEDALSAGGDSDVWMRGFVSLHPVYTAGEASRAAIRDAEGAAAASSPATRLADYEVQDYEWYRVARLLPTTNTPVQVGPAMMTEARTLLPPGRSVLHVLCSAPHLFHVEVDPRQTASLDKGETNTQASGLSLAEDERRLSVRCQFTLDPAYGVTVKETREQLVQGLEELKRTPPVRTAAGKKPIDRTKRRALRRKLQYLTNVTPYFDDRVLAVQLLDLLPATGAVLVADLVGALPDEARNALPANLRAIFTKFPDYFVYFHDGVADGAYVQRADLPAPSVRSIESIDAEELLQVVLTRYPMREHPECGTTFRKCLDVLPHPYRRRVMQLRDVREEILLRFPDKVEILPDTGGGRGLSELVEHSSRETKGRDDLLVPFRFVGEWQELLTQRYEKFCAKHHYDPDVRQPRHHSHER